MTMKEHIQDVAKVTIANSTAFGLSLTDMETIVRIAGLLAALVYTVVKTIHAVKQLKRKGK